MVCSMTEYLQIAILPMLLTLGSYRIGMLLQQKLRSPICNPVLISMVLVLVFFRLTGMQNQDYQSGMRIMSWLLTPATVCLAIPMYQHLSVLKKNLPAILAGITAGAVVSLVFVAIWCLLLRYDRSLMMSLLPKSVTSAIGAPLAQMAGGLMPITTAVIIITGILGNIAGPLLCRIFRIRGQIAQGVAYGTAAHVIGTAKANELSELTGAISSLSLVVAGLVTAVLFPIATAII